MNIAFFGSSLVSAYWNGAATYYRGILKALAALGHRITFYEPDAYDRQAHRDMADPPWARIVVYPANLPSLERVLGAGARADLVVKASGVGVFDAELEAGVLDLGRPAIFWDVDAPATLDRIQADPADAMRGHIPRYQLIFTYGGGAPVVDAYRALGARDCIPVYNALDPATHHPVAPEPRFAADLAFLGNRLPDREARVEAFFIAAAASSPDRRFLMGGNGWQDKALPPNIRALGHVFTADHNALNCSSLAVLNINRDSMARYGFSPPTRVFEAAGAGACLISDAWEGIELFLEPGREVLVARDGAEVAAHLASLDPARARAMGEAALARVLAHHTYASRALLVDGILAGRAMTTPAA